MTQKRFFEILGWLVHPLSLLPLALIAWDYATGNLGFNPIDELTHRTGTPAIILLMLSLACTPLNILFGWKGVTALRKPLGLYGFLYVALHLLVFSVLDYNLNLGQIWGEIVEKRYVLAGFLAFLLLLPVALTSTKGWMRRLGKNWKRLHYLVYVIVPLGVLHYLWLSKDARKPLLYGAIVLGLLALRLPPVRRFFSNLRPRPRPRTLPKKEPTA